MIKLESPLLPGWEHIMTVSCFGFGGVAAPLVGVAGAAAILPLGAVTSVAVLLAAASCLLLVRRPATAADHATHTVVVEI